MSTRSCLHGSLASDHAALTHRKNPQTESLHGLVNPAQQISVASSSVTEAQTLRALPTQRMNLVAFAQDVRIQ